MNKLLLFAAVLLSAVSATAANKYDNPDTLFVARDGTGEFRTVNEAVEVCRAFMEYHKVIFVKKGVYKEKVIIPSWLTNIEICGEDAQQTVITYDDHANIRIPKIGDEGAATQPMGTFRTYTVKVEGQDITFKNITIENNSARLGQAVALHTEGDHFIFGPSTAWFEQCTIKSKANSYITAASTPKDVKYGYVFNRCKLIAAEGADKVFLGRPWRPYAYTLFINTEMGNHIVAEGWENWRNPENEKTARYAEYGSTGPGANTNARVTWSRQLTKKEAQAITLQSVMGDWKVE